MSGSLEISQTAVAAAPIAAGEAELDAKVRLQEMAGDPREGGIPWCRPGWGTGWRDGVGRKGRQELEASRRRLASGELNSSDHRQPCFHKCHPTARSTPGTCPDLVFLKPKGPPLPSDPRLPGGAAGSGEAGPGSRRSCGAHWPCPDHGNGRQPGTWACSGGAGAGWREPGVTWGLRRVLACAGSQKWQLLCRVCELSQGPQR